MKQNKHKLIILDRDGVINEQNYAFIKNIDEFVLIDSSIQAIKQLKNAKWRIAVATNQSGISRGITTEKELHLMHDFMLQKLRANGGDIDYIEYCPHQPFDHCQCRKPKTKMLENIFFHFKIHKEHDNIKEICFVGDSVCDIKMAINFGITPCLVLTGDGKKTLELLKQENITSMLVFDNLYQLTQELLKHDLGI